MKKLKDLRELEELLSTDANKQELVEEIIGYFGEEDAQLILNIVLYFKYPSKYFYLRKELLSALEVSHEL